MVDVVFSWAYFATGPAGKSEIHANCWCSLLGSDCTNNWHPQILHNKRFSSHETGNNFSIKAATPILRGFWGSNRFILTTSLQKNSISKIAATPFRIPIEMSMDWMWLETTPPSKFPRGIIHEAILSVKVVTLPRTLSSIWHGDIFSWAANYRQWTVRINWRLGQSVYRPAGAATRV